MGGKGCFIRENQAVLLLQAMLGTALHLAPCSLSNWVLSL